LWPCAPTSHRWAGGRDLAAPRRDGPAPANPDTAPLLRCCPNPLVWTDALGWVHLAHWSASGPPPGRPDAAPLPARPHAAIAAALHAAADGTDLRVTEHPELPGARLNRTTRRGIPPTQTPRHHCRTLATWGRRCLPRRTPGHPRLRRHDRRRRSRGRGSASRLADATHARPGMFGPAPAGSEDPALTRHNPGCRHLSALMTRQRRLDRRHIPVLQIVEQRSQYAHRRQPAAVLPPRRTARKPLRPGSSQLSGGQPLDRQPTIQLAHHQDIAAHRPSRRKPRCSSPTPIAARDLPPTGPRHDPTQHCCHTVLPLTGDAMPPQGKTHAKPVSTAAAIIPTSAAHHAREPPATTTPRAGPRHTSG